VEQEQEVWAEKSVIAALVEKEKKNQPRSRFVVSFRGVSSNGICAVLFMLTFFFGDLPFLFIQALCRLLQ
jgi:hypothetical protein